MDISHGLVLPVNIYLPRESLRLLNGKCDLCSLDIVLAVAEHLDDIGTKIGEEDRTSFLSSRAHDHIASRVLCAFG